MQWPKFRCETSRPTDCVIAVTYLCNSRCVMCDFWKETRQPTMTLDDYHKLPSSLRDVNVSGGEPFLRPDLIDVIGAIRQACPRARIIISTNGLFTDRIIETMRRILTIEPRIGVRVSIDGTGVMHERIRRIPQAFDKALATLRGLAATGVRDLGIAYTMVGENAGHLTEIYDLARREGVDFTCAAAQSSDVYFGGKRFELNIDPAVVAREFNAVVTSELRRWNPKSWVRAYFIDGLRQLVLRGAQALPSRPGTDFFFLDPFGNVYPSVVHATTIGNLREATTFEEIWNSDIAAAARYAAATDVHPCWMVCTARTAIRRHAFRVIWWIIRRKLAAFFGINT
ncbi:MAG: radical SAM protein [Candidatus Uhrbacteria bacterium]